MNKKLKLGVGVGVAVLVLVIVVVVVIAIVVYRRIRRNRAAFKKKATLRTGTVNTLPITTVETSVNYRISRDVNVNTAGDRNQDSVQGLQVGQGDNGGAKAFPPPVGVQPPPVPHA